MARISVFLAHTGKHQSYKAPNSDNTRSTAALTFPLVAVRADGIEGGQEPVKRRTASVGGIVVETHVSHLLELRCKPLSRCLYLRLKI